jgi:transposase InsO family protein
LTGLKSLRLLLRIKQRKELMPRTDNERQFRGNEFEEFRNKLGIERQKNTPCTPQQNGVAERLNMMLMEKARCMLSGAGLVQ